jgi:hypothetical protein
LQLQLGEQLQERGLLFVLDSWSDLESFTADLSFWQQEGLQHFAPSFCAGHISFAAQQPGLSFCNGHAEAGFSFVWGSA